ncbi:hypothetical protein [Rhodobacter sp. NTK016B]|uniref:hypothetical protein n=1 Tax=Rhodobacter sp. NTK016B TaxID=2759676 RepID=UPI0025708A97|nr:hypothetical protein [Rhodobacter sp. NTK016B]
MASSTLAPRTGRRAAPPATNETPNKGAMMALVYGDAEGISRVESPRPVVEASTDAIVRVTRTTI